MCTARCISWQIFTNRKDLISLVLIGTKGNEGKNRGLRMLETNALLFFSLTSMTLSTRPSATRAGTSNERAGEGQYQNITVARPAEIPDLNFVRYLQDQIKPGKVHGDCTHRLCHCCAVSMQTLLTDINNLHLPSRGRPGCRNRPHRPDGRHKEV